jgi:hypothetical protein
MDKIVGVSHFIYIARVSVVHLAWEQTKTFVMCKLI